MFEAIRNRAEGQGLDRSKHRGSSLPIRHHTRQRWYFTDPPAIFFLFQLDLKLGYFRQASRLASKLSPQQAKMQEAVRIFNVQCSMFNASVALPTK